MLQAFKSVLSKSLPDKQPTVFLDSTGRISAIGCPGFAHTVLVERRAAEPTPLVHTLPQDCSDSALKNLIPIVVCMNEKNSFSCNQSLLEVLHLLSGK